MVRFAIFPGKNVVRHRTQASTASKKEAEEKKENNDAKGGSIGSGVNGVNPFISTFSLYEYFTLTMYLSLTHSLFHSSTPTNNALHFSFLHLVTSCSYS